MKLSANHAAKEAGIAKKTLLDALKTGRMSAEKDERGYWQIDPAELFRVFPKPSQSDHAQPFPTPSMTQAETDILVQLGTLRAELDAEKRMTAAHEARIAELQDQRDKWQRQAEILLLQAPKPKPSRRGFLGFLGRASEA